jgi:hypothetical protein
MILSGIKFTCYKLFLQFRFAAIGLHVHFKTDDSSNILIRQTSLKLRELVQMIISMISFESDKQSFLCENNSIEA